MECVILRRMRPTIDVIIDTPRCGFIKRHDDGTIDFISPLPSPFNYGSFPDTQSDDGDREDALVLGAQRRAGSRVTTVLWGRVKFIDAGKEDPKWVCGPHPPTRAERLLIDGFFGLYAVFKRLLNRLRKTPGETRYCGYEPLAIEGSPCHPNDSSST